VSSKSEVSVFNPLLKQLFPVNLLKYVAIFDLYVSCSRLIFSVNKADTMLYCVKADAMFTFEDHMAQGPVAIKEVFTVSIFFF